MKDSKDGVLVFLLFGAVGFVILTLGYPGYWTLLVGGGVLLASYGTAYWTLARQPSFGSKGPGSLPEKPPLYVSPKSQADPVKSIGLRLKEKAEGK